MGASGSPFLPFDRENAGGFPRQTSSAQKPPQTSLFRAISVRLRRINVNRPLCESRVLYWLSPGAGVLRRVELS
jgi:hypothetical protein